MFGFLSPSLYLRITPSDVHIRSHKDGTLWHDDAVVAIGSPGPKARLIAIGAAARLAAAQTPGAELHGVFDHPRCLLSDYTLAEAFLKQALYEAMKNRWFSPSPNLLLHACPSPEQLQGGMTGVELRALRELGMRCGAKCVELVQPIALSEAQIAELLRANAR